MSDISTVVDQVGRAWRNLKSAMAIVDGLKPQLELGHSTLIDFAIQNIDEAKLRHGPLTDLPVGRFALLKTGGAPSDWSVVTARHVEDPFSGAQCVEIVNIEGDREFCRFEVLCSSKADWSWAELEDPDNVFTNPKFRKAEA